MKIDTTTDFGRRVERRLREETVAWVTTVGADGTPQPSPIWFLWDGRTIVVYSQPNTPKVRNIERSGKVSLNLDGDGHGGDIVILTGDARILEDAPPPTEVPAFVGKYRDDLRSVQSSEDFARTMHGYDLAIRVTPTGLRGF